MLSLLFFDNFVKYNFQRFLAKNQDTIFNETQKKEIKHMLTCIKNAKRSWFIFHFVNRQEQRSRDDLHTRIERLSSKSPEWQNIFRRHISETDESKQEVVQAIESEKRKVYATMVEMTK